jgi:nicotinamidase-related amidase
MLEKKISDTDVLILVDVQNDFCPGTAASPCPRAMRSSCRSTASPAASPMWC